MAELPLKDKSDDEDEVSIVLDDLEDMHMPLPNRALGKTESISRLSKRELFS